MKPKEYLSQYQTLLKQIAELSAQIVEIEADATGVGNMSYEAKAPSSNPNTRSPQERVVGRLMEIRERKAELVRQKHEMCERITEQIYGLNSAQYQEILLLRYIRGYKLEQIAIEMGYSYDWVRSRHGRALQAFGLQFPECVKA